MVDAGSDGCATFHALELPLILTTALAFMANTDAPPTNQPQPHGPR
jgi:hypothetical protein